MYQQNNKNLKSCRQPFFPHFSDECATFREKLRRELEDSRIQLNIKQDDANHSLFSGKKPD